MNRQGAVAVVTGGGSGLGAAVARELAAAGAVPVILDLRTERVAQVVRELEGAGARGFARFRCDGCAREILVAFSCKGRICPSCCGRRMGERAAHLVDGVLGGLPVRQWVLTLPSDPRVP